MSVQTSYPGVYIEEKPSGAAVISPVPVANLLAIGMTQKGQMNAVTRVLDYDSFLREFGDTDDPSNEMNVQIRQFFMGGGEAYIIRTALNPIKAETRLTNEFGDPVMTIEARDEGRFGNQIRMLVDYQTANPEISFNLTVYREQIDTQGRYSRDEEEIYNNLNMMPDSPNYIGTVLSSRSKLIRLKNEQGSVSNTLNRCFSQSGLLFDDFAAMNAFLAANPTATNLALVINETFRFEVNIGGLSDLADLTSRLNAALSANNAPGSVSTTMESFAGSEALRIVRADTDIWSIEVQSARQNDAAALLQMGVNQGGLESSPYSERRPAPTGYFTSLGTSYRNANRRITQIASCLSVDLADSNQLTWTDPSGSQTMTWLAAPGGGNFASGNNTDGNGSLLNFREHLNAMVAALNGTFGQNWQFSRAGFRIHAQSSQTGPAGFGGVASLATATTNLAIFSGAQNANIRAFALGDEQSDYASNPVVGENGTAPTLPQYQTAFALAEQEVEVFNMMILPRCPGQDDTARQNIWGAASAACRDNFAFLIMDPPSDNNAWADVNQVDAGIDSMRNGVVTTHAALYWPRVIVPDGANRRVVDPCGTVAGVFATTAARLGVWHAPAGMQAIMTGTVGLEHLVSDKENGVINVKAVNVLRQFSSGLNVWGARTCIGFDGSGEFDYNTVAVRQTASMIEQSLKRGLRHIIFEPNNEFTWSNMRRTARSFMHSLFLQGAFKGEKADDAYKVICDASINSPSEIMLGRVNLLVMFMPLRHVEYVVVRIQQIMALPEA